MDKLLNKIVSIYDEYVDFEKIVKSKNESIKNREGTVRDALKGKSIEAIEDVLIHIYVDAVLYNKDLQMIFIKLVSLIETYIEVSNEDLPKEILEFYTNMKQWTPKRVFVIEKNELVETEEGILESARKEFLESDFFKNIVDKASE